MKLRNITEEDLAQFILNRDRDPIERVRRTAQRSVMTNWKDSPEANHSPMRKVSGSTVRPRQASSPYKSKWDEAYGYVLVLEKRTGLIRDYGYETMTLRLSKGKYHRPDYTVWHFDGTIELRQIKGYHKNLRASLTALKWAAQKHPWYRFTLWRKYGSGWEHEDVEV